MTAREPGAVFAVAGTVPSAGVIQDVSTTLQTFLTPVLAGLATPTVADLDNPPDGSPPTLTIFLYDIVEDPNLRNRPVTRTPAPPPSSGPLQVKVQKPPMALLLRYMMTPWAGTTLEEHEMIGRVLEAFYDHTTLSGPHLQGPSLANTDQALRIALLPIELDNRARIWEAIEKPYRLSINYEVRVVQIDSKYAHDVPAVTEQVVQPALAKGQR